MTQKVVKVTHSGDQKWSISITWDCFFWCFSEKIGFISESCIDVFDMQCTEISFWHATFAAFDGDMRARPMLGQYASFLSSQGVRHKKPVVNGANGGAARTGLDA